MQDKKHEGESKYCEMQQDSPILTLPPEVVHHIGSLMDPNTIPTARLGCRFFRDCFQPFLNKIVQIAAGDCHLVMLKADGQIVVSGSNDHGQKGLGEQPTPSQPTTLKLDVKVRQVAASHNHTLFLGENGKVYGCGDNTHHQLGGSSSKYFLPTLIPGLPNIIQIETLGTLSLFLSEERQLLICGRFGAKTVFVTPVVFCEHAIRQIAVYHNVAICLLANGMLKALYSLPSRVVLLQYTDIKKIIAATRSFILLLKNDDSLVCHGSLSPGNFDHLSEKDIQRLRDICQVTEDRISTTTFFLKNNGTVFKFKESSDHLNELMSSYYKISSYYLDKILKDVKQIIPVYSGVLFLMKDGSFMGLGSLRKIGLDDGKISDYQFYQEQLDHVELRPIRLQDIIQNVQPPAEKRCALQ